NPGGAHDSHAVLIAAFEHFFRRHMQALPLARNLAEFHIKIPGKLVPADLYWAANQVGLARRLTRILALRARCWLHRQSAQHRRLARTSGGATLPSCRAGSV